MGIVLVHKRTTNINTIHTLVILIIAHQKSRAYESAKCCVWAVLRLGRKFLTGEYYCFCCIM